ncbi:uncharacterized protein LOC131854725 [Achroia grisella]|uniref:uncharacterized protein LOC131854725 n=1 Tax=Achroia grisella TaxID=688607 RepID=UPI0027D3251B|nr:uncharacterized protein LOC131854725 [Achroia grisella]
MAVSVDDNKLRIFKLSYNLITHVLIGIIITITSLFVFTNGIPLQGMNLHILLCTVGYQLLMAEGFLCLVPENSWTLTISLVNKRRIHWILQVMGSSLAIAGSYIIMELKEAHWETLHGSYGLVALICTIISLVNGLTSLYAYELSKYIRIPPNLSKVPHILIGVIAFVTSSISLCYGYDMYFFRNWLTPRLGTISIVFTATFTSIIIINPMTLAINKIINIFKK